MESGSSPPEVLLRLVSCVNCHIQQSSSHSSLHRAVKGIIASYGDYLAKVLEMVKTEGFDTEALEFETERLLSKYWTDVLLGLA